MIEYFTNSYILSILIGTFITLIVYLSRDKKNLERKNSYYFKILIISIIIVFCILYFFKPKFNLLQTDIPDIESNVNNIKVGGNNIKVGECNNNNIKVGGINRDDIYTGIPDF